MSDSPTFTPKQGQYLAFIHLYSKLNRQPPAEADIQRYFGTSAPSVHSMIVRLEELGMIARERGEARTICVLLDPNDLPDLE
ncbi:MAG: LexA family protein [Bradymonadaceae bacterium]